MSKVDRIPAESLGANEAPGLPPTSVIGDSLALLERLIPEGIEQLRRRYLLLETTRSLQPIGRRALADELGWTERVTRAEIDAMRASGLIGVESDGVSATQVGANLLPSLAMIMNQVKELDRLTAEVKAKYGLQYVVVVPGDSRQSQLSRHLLAHAAGEFLSSIIQDGDVVAVTGGTTMRDVADNMPTSKSMSKATIVPARGGLGEDLEIQANTVVDIMSRALGAQHRLLHLADEVQDEALDALMSDATVRDLFSLIRSARIVVHGIGAIEDVVRRRHLPEGVLELVRNQAAGEILGYYLDGDVNLIHSTSSVGIRWEDLQRTAHVIAVAGGARKARAVRAVLASGLQTALFVDEALARRLVV